MKKALDLFCCAGGVSVGLERAGFEVVGVDINPQPHHRGGTFVQADALNYPLEGFDFIWASPPCQAHSSLRHLHAGKVYPDLIPAMRARLEASGVPWCIENVPGAPLGSSGHLIMLCGTMFGLQTPDGRAELRRHRLFETSFSIPLRPACQHGYRPESLSVSGTGMGPGNKGKDSSVKARRALSVTGHSYHTADSHPDSRKVITVSGDRPNSANTPRRVLCVAGGMAETGASAARERFSINDARAAMGIDWMPMKYLSQAIPPAYAEWIGRQALEYLATL